MSKTKNGYWKKKQKKEVVPKASLLYLTMEITICLELLPRLPVRTTSVHLFILTGIVNRVPAPMLNYTFWVCALRNQDNHDPPRL